MTDAIDLTVTLDDETPTFPDDPEAEIADASTVEEDGYAVKRLTFPSHFGTHIDAPAHFFSDGRTLDDYPPDRFFGQAVVVDARGEDEIDVGYGAVDGADVVLFRTEHVRNIGEVDYYDDGPVLTEEAAETVVDAGVEVVGIDSFSPDEEPYPVHHILLGNDVLIAENLTNLGELPERGFRCFLSPLKIADSDGAPCRAVAVLG